MSSGIDAVTQVARESCPINGGMFNWTADELEAMAIYEARLRGGDLELAPRARRAHASDKRTIQAWYGFGRPSPYGLEVIARITRRMVARSQVFRRCGLDLNVTP
jgi:hypothetical protein